MAGAAHGLQILQAMIILSTDVIDLHKLRIGQSTIGAGVFITLQRVLSGLEPGGLITLFEPLARPHHRWV